MHQKSDRTIVIKSGMSRKTLAEKIANEADSTEGRKKHKAAMDFQDEVQRGLNQEVQKGGGFIEDDQAEAWVEGHQERAPTRKVKKANSGGWKRYVVRKGRLVPTFSRDYARTVAQGR